MAKSADFYVTCATVIPVLFLAVAVQGRAHESLLRAAPAAARAWRRGRWSDRIGMMVISWILQFFAYGVVLAGGLGEFLALAVLYRGYQRPGDRAMVFAGTLLLVAAVIAGPFLAYGQLRDDLDTARYGDGAGRTPGKHETGKGTGSEQRASPVGRSSGEGPYGG